ncbi:MAG: peroxiredoxin [Simkaniaceae bacterium]|nr:peroxiredoxin [Simkaniaceae bacterium]
MGLVGKKGPNFKAAAVVNGGIIPNFTLDDFLDQYVVLFFYPLDFTFVCPTELHAFQEALPEFKKRGVQLMGCSVDSPYAHLAWQGLPRSKGGIEGITYPLISDLTKEIARNYGVLIEEQGVAYRGLFIMDRQGIVRHELINDLPLGRSVHEVLRTLDALMFFEANGEVCPANWSQGDKAMKPTQEGLKTYFN